jgi:hypothetical protein
MNKSKGEITEGSEKTVDLRATDITESFLAFINRYLLRKTGVYGMSSADDIRVRSQRVRRV